MCETWFELDSVDIECISLILVFVGFVVGTWVAIVQIRQRRRVTARRATLEFIVTHEIHNSEWIECCEAFKAWKSRGYNTNRIVDPQSHDDRSIAVRVLTVLNHFESVAVGINNQIIDEALYKGWYRSTYIEYWQASEQLVKDLRLHHKSEVLYDRFENTANRWLQEASSSGR